MILSLIAQPFSSFKELSHYLEKNSNLRGGEDGGEPRERGWAVLKRKRTKQL